MLVPSHYEAYILPAPQNAVLYSLFKLWAISTERSFAPYYLIAQEHLKYTHFVKMVVAAPTAGIYDAVLIRRQALMGDSGPAALVKNGRVFMIAMFACIGGLLYGQWKFLI